MQLEGPRTLAPSVFSRVPLSTPVLYLSSSMRCGRVYLFYIERARTLFRRCEHPSSARTTTFAVMKHVDDIAPRKPWSKYALDNVFDSTTLGPGRLVLADRPVPRGENIELNHKYQQSPLLPHFPFLFSFVPCSSTSSRYRFSVAI